ALQVSLPPCLPPHLPAWAPAPAPPNPKARPPAAPLLAVPSFPPPPSPVCKRPAPGYKTTKRHPPKAAKAKAEIQLVRQDCAASSSPPPANCRRSDRALPAPEQAECAPHFAVEYFPPPPKFPNPT